VPSQQIACQNNQASTCCQQHASGTCTNCFDVSPWQRSYSSSWFSSRH